MEQRILALFFFAFAFLTRRRQAELGPLVLKEMAAFRYIFYLLGTMATAISVLQAYNALKSGVFWIFYAAITFQLAVGVVQFARMILLPPHPERDLDG